MIRSNHCGMNIVDFLLFYYLIFIIIIIILVRNMFARFTGSMKYFFFPCDARNINIIYFNSISISKALRNFKKLL